MYTFLCVRVFLFLLGILLGVEWLGYMVTVCLALSETARLFSRAAAPLYISTHRVRGFQLLHILANACYCLSF